MDGNIFNSRGVHVAIVIGTDIFDLKGRKLYELRGVNIYKLSGELIGYLTDAKSTTKHLDKSTDKLFGVNHLLQRTDRVESKWKMKKFPPWLLDAIAPIGRPMFLVAIIMFLAFV